jgi:hypothetical protein
MASETSISEGLERTIIAFCRFVRAEGLSAGVKESVTALEAARAVGIADRELLRLALRSVLCSSKDEWDKFDELFWIFWRDSDRQASRKKRPSRSQKKDDRLPESAVSTFMGKSNASGEQEDGGRAVIGAAATERLKRADFSQVQQKDMAELERLAVRLLRQMSMRLSRRMKIMRPRGRVDLRRTIRRSISRGGDPVYLSFRDKKLQQDRLTVLLDISGSMNAYSLFLLRFAYALQKHFKRVDTFLFSTQLAEITPMLRSRELHQALFALGEVSAGWSGGTKIGESLRDFIVFHGRRLLTRNTLFLILSDGWDTGEPEVLAAQLDAIKRRVRKVVWLNPLLGMSEYQPVTRGMSAALPYIDVFAPAHNLESLLALEKHLIRS